MAERTPQEIKFMVATWYSKLSPETLEFLGNRAVDIYQNLQMPHSAENQIKVIQRKLRAEVQNINSVVNASSTRW